MKPNFALSLSSDGIRLLHLAAGEWHLVGRADVLSPTLTDELAVLRRTATSLEPSGLRSKLILPADQIRFLQITTPKGDAHSLRTAVLAALEGATPYAVTELVFDTYVAGDTTHIAAVARETLAEAESFAIEHRFNPVRFVAEQTDTGFGAAPDFGPTVAATHAAPAPERSATIPPAPKDEPLPAVEEPSDDAPSVDFVSIRKVPTFRTQVIPSDVVAGLNEASAGAVPGFEDAAEPFAHRKPQKTRATRPETVPAPAPISRAVHSEAERLTIYGANTAARSRSRVGPAGVGLAALAVVCVGVIAFASTATTSGLKGLFTRSSEPAAQFSAPLQPNPPETPNSIAEQNPSIELVALERELTDEDAAVLDALSAPVLAEPVTPPAPTQEDLRADYAVSGIWAIAPDVPSPPALMDLDDLYVTSIDPINQNFDAVALPALQALDSDISFMAPASPAPAGTLFALDENGLVVPTPQGSLNPDGVMVFAGAPPVRQPAAMLRIEDPGEDLAQRIVLAGFRPTARPADLIETTERANLDGLTRSELSLLRPRLRPQSAQENARASASLVQLDSATGSILLPPQGENDFDGATARAVAASLRPDARPNNFSAIVARTQRAAPAPQPVATASVAPRVVTPKIPSSASASRAATVENAINLRQVNLIGVYGKPSARRALVRMSNGRYRKVEVGDRIDGGLVSAIGDAELRYQKRGKAIVLKMPRG
ncbi:MAG: hypothetical protein AB8B47_12900 [Roseobacter sp.]